MFNLYCILNHIKLSSIPQTQPSTIPIINTFKHSFDVKYCNFGWNLKQSFHIHNLLFELYCHWNHTQKKKKFVSQFIGCGCLDLLHSIKKNLSSENETLNWIKKNYINLHECKMSFSFSQPHKRKDWSSNFHKKKKKNSFNRNVWDD